MTTLRVRHLASLILLLCYGLVSAQSLSYPGASHRFKRGEVSGYLSIGMDLVSAATGMDGYAVVAVSDTSFSSQVSAVFDSAFNRKFFIEPQLTQSLSHAAISSDRNIWYVQSSQGNTRISIISESRVLLQSLRINGYRCAGVFADSLGKVRLIIHNSTGLGMVQFSNAGTIDFARWASIPSMGTPRMCKMGIDGRFQIQTASLVTYTMDLAGYIRKVMVPPSGYLPGPAYADHSHAFLEQSFGGNRRLRVCRLDSNMAPVWGMEFLVSDNSAGNDSIIDGIDGVVEAGTQNLVLAMNISSPGAFSANCSFPFGYFNVRQATVGPDGSLRSKGNLDIFAWGQTMKRMYNGAHGEPLLVDFDHTCFGPALGPRAVQLRQFPDNYWSVECNPAFNASVYNPSYFSAPSGSLLAVPATAPLTLTLLTDVATVNLANGGFSGTTTCLPPCAKIYAANVLPGGQVQFLDSLSGCSAITYAFGDGTFGSNADPVHAFPGPGSYLIQLFATNECGSDTTTLGPVDPCRSAAMTLPPSGCVGSTYTVTQATAFAADSIQWLVNGAVAGSGNTLNVAPSLPGIYQIGIVLKDGACRDTTTMPLQVYSGVPAPDFAYQSLGGTSVQFTNTSGGASGSSWDFGDGNGSTAFHAQHTYAGQGPYTICLTASNACGIADTCKALPCSFPIADFGLTWLGNGQIGLSDSSLGATTWSWDFGDGHTATGAVTGHTYAQSGDFNICLIVTNACFADTFCQSISMVANNQAQFRVGVGGLQQAEPKGQALSDDAWIALVGTCTAGQFMTLLDSTGCERWTFLLPTSLYQLSDIAAMPNGNYVVVGANRATTATPYGGIWMEVDRQGNIVRSSKLAGTIGEQLYTVRRARYGGYLFTGRTNNTLSGIYGRLDDQLQLQWSRSTGLWVEGIVQAPDSTLWTIQRAPWVANQLKYVHMNQNGIATQEATHTLTIFPMNNIPTNFRVDMDCAGVIVVSLTLPQYGSQWGAETNFAGIYFYNTADGLGWSNEINIGTGLFALYPEYECFVNDVAFVGAGDARIMGYAYPRAGIGTSPRLQRLLIEASYGAQFTYPFLEGGPANDEKGWTIGILPGGNTLASTRIDGELHVEKRSGYNNNCDALPDDYVTKLTFGGNLAPSGLSPATGTYAPYGTQAAFSLAPTQAQYTPAVQCVKPCTTSVQASIATTVSGNTITLTATATPGASLVWSMPGGACASGNAVSVTLAPCESRTIQLTAANACDITTITRTVSLPGGITAPIADPLLLPDSVGRCPQAAVTLTAGGAYAAYLWAHGDTTTSTTVNTSGSFSVMGIDSAGCYHGDTTTVWTMGTMVALGPDTSICPGQGTNLSVGTGFTTASWSTGATTLNISVTQAGLYAVTATDTDGCLSSDTLMVALYAAVPVALGGDTTLCPSESVLLGIGSGYVAATWSTGATTLSISVAQAGQYAVTATDGNGCVSSDTVQVGVHAPAPVALGNDTTIIAGNSLLLDAGAGYTSYLWSTGATSATIMVTQAGTYWVQATDLNGCVVTDTIVVDVVIGMEEVWADGLILSPVPARDRVRIALAMGTEVCVALSVSDALGRRVWTRAIHCDNSVDLEIDVRGWASGSYYLRIEGESVGITRKFEVVH